MPASRLDPIIRHLRQTVQRPDVAALSDGQLLEAFITRHDAPAFEALLRRHGPMVLGVCRRVLRHTHDAEDAFQATFLVLARKAGSVSPREMVGNWLYGVAHTTALRARVANAKRQARERQVADMPEPEHATAARQDPWHDLQPLLDQELAALPAKYRVPIVLCDLEGRTRREVAGRLKVPEGTLSSRLTTGRRLLAKRLARHGLHCSAGALAGLLTQHAAACLPASMVSVTMKAVTLVAAGQAGADGLVSAQVAALTEGVLKVMLLKKLKFASVLLVLAGLVALAAGLLPGSQATAVAQPVPARGARLPAEEDQLQGSWFLVSRTQDGTKQEYPQGAGVTLSFSAAELRFAAQPINPLGNPWETITSAYTYRLDPTQKPKTIDLLDVRDGAFLKGIYRCEDDRLLICWALAGGKERPTDFTAIAKANRVLTVYRRADTRPGTTVEPPAQRRKTDPAEPLRGGNSERAEPTRASWANKLFEETSWDFGTCLRGEKLRHRFKIVNIYATPIEVTQVRSSCGCVTATMDFRTLQPNETSYLEVAVDSTRFVGARTAKVYVTIGGDYQATAELTVKATSNLLPEPSLGNPVDGRFGDDVHQVSARAITIPFRVAPQRREELKRLILFCSTDRGETWKQAATAHPDEASFSFLAPDDGLYWFRVSVVARDGTTEPPEPQGTQAAQLKILVKPGR
jgi:RNA polymerase sigma factor (sigma-70 family)